MTEKLKPCPFCGCEAEIYSDSGYWYINCIECRVEITGHESRELTVEKWERRVENASNV